MHSVLVALRLLSPALYDPAVDRRQMVSITILNAFTLAVACWCVQAEQDSVPGKEVNPTP